MLPLSIHISISSSKKKKKEKTPTSQKHEIPTKNYKLTRRLLVVPPSMNFESGLEPDRIRSADNRIVIKGRTSDG